MPTLYRQYRPQLFKEVVGQDHITTTLKRAADTDRLSHAYLFYGPRGTGKTTTARILAKRFNCSEPHGGEPCGYCRSCTAVQEGRHIDVIEIDAASNRGIDDIRNLQEGISLKPSMGNYKVYIIDEVHMLTKEAFTALLKTVEEPSQHAVFILATTEFHKVPETVISRCQVYRFRRATDQQMNERLKYLLKRENREAEDGALSFIIKRSDGCYRDAESLLGQILSINDERVTAEQLADFLGLPPDELIDKFLAGLIRGESRPAVEALEEIFKQGFDPEQFVNESIRMSRNGALGIIKGNIKDDKSLSKRMFVQEQSALLRLPQVIRALVQAVQDLAYVPQPLIALDLAVLSLCTRKGEAEIPVPATTSKTVEKTTVKMPTASEKGVVVEKVIREAAPVPASISDTTPIVSVEKVKEVWPQVIDAAKGFNPVSSTFLRAVEPVEVQDSVVRLRAQYALHRTFFEKPENKEPVEEALSKIIHIKVSIRCFLDEGMSQQPVANTRSQEKELVAAVKEVFG